MCPEHAGWAYQNFQKWWTQRSRDPLPDSAQLAVDIAEAGGVAMTRKITVRQIAGEKFDRIIKHELGEVPEALPAGMALGYDDSEIPF